MKVAAQLQGLAEARGVMSDLAHKQMPFATVVALNRLAFGARQAWAKLAETVFDRPTSLTKKAALYDKATLAKPTAEIKLRDEAPRGTPPVKYLAPEVYGGSRPLRRFERWLIARGLMPRGMFAVPGAGAKLDAYGNLAGGQFTKILSALGAHPDVYSNTTANSRSRRKRTRGGQYFAVLVKQGNLVPGIYERINFAFGSSVRPIVVYVRAPQYRIRYSVFDVANEYVAANAVPVLNQALDEAILSTLARNAVRG